MKENLKINILYNFHKGAWGGGNQFLKALRKWLIKFNFYESNPKIANCILFNSHHNIEKVLKLKLKYQDKLFIHRIDGPISLIRDDRAKLDSLIYKINYIIADGTIFQSEWSMKKNRLLSFKKKNFETIIYNACDSSIFFPSNEEVTNRKADNKFKLIAVSWSANYNKGFDLYQFLDENLNFQEYSMRFVGNSNIKFRNIEHIKPVDSNSLAKLLRESDIYIIGSKNDPCSNSLIEALTCGLPSVVLNDGGHPEIIKKGGESFYSLEDSISKINLIKENYEEYRSNIQIPNIEEITEQYIDFIKKAYLNSLQNKYKPKKLKLIDFYKIYYYQKRYQGLNIKTIPKQFKQFLLSIKRES